MLVHLAQTLPELSVDITGIFQFAIQIVNMLMPLLAITAGIGFGFNLINKIGSLFNRAF